MMFHRPLPDCLIPSDHGAQAVLFGPASHRRSMEDLRALDHQAVLLDQMSSRNPATVEDLQAYVLACYVTDGALRLAETIILQWRRRDTPADLIALFEAMLKLKRREQESPR